MRINGKDCAIICSAFLLGVLCGNTFAQSPIVSRLSSFNLSSTTFEFPGGGQRNNNASIGDFCCTGETAAVLTDQQKPVGYIYFYDFRDAYNTEDNGRRRSAAGQFSVLVSGIADTARPDSDRVKSSIHFTAPELKPGLSRHTVAGTLQFTATVLDVEFTDSSHSKYWMDGIKVRIEVQQVSDEENPDAQSATAGPSGRF